MATIKKNYTPSRKLLGAEKFEKAYKAGKLNPSKKVYEEDQSESDFFLERAKAIYAEYVSNNCLVPYSQSNLAGGRRSFEEIKAYALGRQDVQQYINLVDKCDENGEQFYNINWDIHPILPKFKDLIRGKLLGSDYEINTQAVDSASAKKRTKTISKIKLAVNPQVQGMMAATKTQLSGVQVPPGVKTPADVDEYQRLGGVRLEREIILKDAIEVVRYESSWKVLKDMMVDDAIDLGIIAALTKVHPKTGKIHVHHISPMDLVIRPSKYPDHHDSDYAGAIRSKTIAQLREESHLTEEEIQEVFKNYSNHGQNKLISEREDYNSFQNTKMTSGFNYDSATIDTLEFFFIEKRAEKYVVGNRKTNNIPIYDKVKKNSKLNNKDKKKGKEISEEFFEYVFKGEWIIGTEYIFDCGVEYAIAKEKKNGIKTAVLPITVYSDNTMSLMERCISHIDDIQLSIFQIRNLLSKTIPAPGILFDLSIMEDSVDIGGAVYTMKDLIANFFKTGIMPYRSKPEFDDEDNGSQRKPFDIINNTGIDNALNMHFTRIASSMEQIRQVTGVNEVADGSTQQQDMLKGVMEGMLSATNNALKPTFRLYEGFIERWAKLCVLKYQASVLGGDIDLEYSPLGDDTKKHFKLTKDLYDYDFGIQINARPSEEDKQMMVQELMQMKANGQIPVDDYYILMDMIKNGDIKKAQRTLAKSVKEHEEILHKRQLEIQQAQAKANGEAGIAIEKAKTEAIQAETAAKKELINTEYDRKKELLEIEIAGRARHQEAAVQGKIGQDIVNKSLEEQEIQK